MSNTDNFDPPEDMDLDPPSDADIDFDDFENNKDKSLGASWKSSPLFKFGVVALVIIIVVALVSILSSDEVQAPQSVVGKGAGAGFKEAPGMKELTPVMKEAIEERNDQRVDEAEKKGISAIPTPITPPKTLLEVPQDSGESEDPLLRWQQMQNERAKAQREQQLVEGQKPQTDPQREAKVGALVQAMSQQIEGILGEQKDQELKHMNVFTPASLPEGGAVDPNGLVSPVTGQPQLAAQKPSKILLPAGKIEYAQMVLEANSDIPGPVVALLASGQFSGAKLIGKFQAQEEYLVITFSTLVTKKGTSIPINAYALDPGTSLTGMATDVDHRYFKRIVLPAAAKFVEGLGEAYAETTSETTQNSTTTTTTTTDLNTKQEFGKAVSEAAKSVGDVLDEDGKNTKPLVIVAAGTPMGILFMESVTDKDVLQARAGVSGSGQQGGQQVSPQLPYPQGFQPQQNTGVTSMQQLQYGLQGQQFMQQSPYNANTILGPYGGTSQQQ